MKKSAGVDHKGRLYVWCSDAESGNLPSRKSRQAAERAQMIFESLERLGNVPEELRDRINGEKDLEILRKWCKLAIGVDTIAQFEQEMES